MPSYSHFPQDDAPAFVSSAPEFSNPFSPDSPGYTSERRDEATRSAATAPQADREAPPPPLPLAPTCERTGKSSEHTAVYSAEGLIMDAMSSSNSDTPLTRLSATEPAFSLDAIPAPTTAQAYWKAEAYVNTARQGLFGDLRRPGRDIYGPTADYPEKDLWGSRTFWYFSTKAPNCDHREPFRLLIRRKHWPRTVALYVAFTVMPVLATIANRNIAHWVMILFYWLPWAATMVMILICSFTNPGIVPRRVGMGKVHDTGDVIVVRVPAPNAEKVLDKLQNIVVIEGQTESHKETEPRATAVAPAPPSAPPTGESAEALRRARAQRLLSTDTQASTAFPPQLSQPGADDAAQREALVLPLPQQHVRIQPQSSGDTTAAETSDRCTTADKMLSTTLSTSGPSGMEKSLVSPLSKRRATIADAVLEPDTPGISPGCADGGAAAGAATTAGAPRFSLPQDPKQQRRLSMAASSLVSHRSAATSNHRYFINSTGAITTEVPPMSEAELTTPHIEIPFRLCRTCGVFRGPRTHHCHKCGGCVDELDHHCPWTNSCIGRHNYRFFLLALILIHITMLYIVFNNVYLTFAFLDNMIHGNYADYLAETYYLPPIIYAAAFVVGFYFSGLGFAHIYMNINGITTFELIKYVFVDSPYYNGVNPWDKGAWRNCTDRILGIHTIQWLDSRYYYPVTVAFLLEEKLLDWRLGLPESERALVDAEELRRRKQIAQAREDQVREIMKAF